MNKNPWISRELFPQQTNQKAARRYVLVKLKNGVEEQGWFYAESTYEKKWIVDGNFEDPLNPVIEWKDYE
jgi:hypothetical protein